VGRRLLIDLGPLRASPPFRRLFLAQSVSLMGSQLTAVAVAFQVFSLTHSSLQVGAVSATQLVPFVGGALVGGAQVGPRARRAVLVVGSVLMAGCSAALAGNALAGARASVAPVYLATALAAGLSGVIATTLTASVPSLVGAGQLTGAFATMQVIDQLGMVAGPAAGGVMIAALGLPWLYGADSLTFLWAAAFLWSTTPGRPRSRPGRGDGARTPGDGGGSERRGVLDGLRYLRGRPVLEGAYVVDLCATLFGSPRAVFPALVRDRFHGGAAVLGVLYATPAAGALVGSLTSGWLGALRRPGRAVLVAVGGWGAAITVLGFAPVLWVAIVPLVVAGWADVVSAVLRSALVQAAVHERYRARMSGVQMAVVEGGPRLGDLESGALASAVSTSFSIVSGGLLCLAGTVAVGLAFPALRAYRRGDGP